MRLMLLRLEYLKTIVRWNHVSSELICDLIVYVIHYINTIKFYLYTYRYI